MNENVFNQEAPITKRLDGTYVVEKNGYPYHVIPDDPIFLAVANFWETAPASLKMEETPPPPLTFEEAFNSIRYVSGKMIDHIEDTFAQSLEYDNFDNMLKRALSTDPVFKHHAEIAADYDAQLWATLRDVIQPTLIQKVQSGQLPLPTHEGEVYEWVTTYVVPFLPLPPNTVDSGQ